MSRTKKRTTVVRRPTPVAHPGAPLCVIDSEATEGRELRLRAYERVNGRAVLRMTGCGDSYFAWLALCYVEDLVTHAGLAHFAHECGRTCGLPVEVEAL